MKILKHGRYYCIDGIKKCECGCKFEYFSEDIMDAVDSTTKIIISRFVKCPECKTLINLYGRDSD